MKATVCRMRPSSISEDYVRGMDSCSASTLKVDGVDSGESRVSMAEMLLAYKR